MFLNCVLMFQTAWILYVRKLTDDEDAADVLTAIALWLEVADCNNMVLNQAVVADVIIYSHDPDQLWVHFGICCNSWNKKAKRGGCGGFTKTSIDIKERRLPAVYSALVKRGFWSLMSSSTMRTSSRLGSRAGSRALARADLWPLGGVQLLLLEALTMME